MIEYNDLNLQVQSTILESVNDLQGLDFVKLDNGQLAFSLKLNELKLFSGLNDTLWLDAPAEVLLNDISDYLTYNGYNDKDYTIDLGGISFTNSLFKISDIYIKYLSDKLIFNGNLDNVVDKIVTYSVSTPKSYKNSDDEITLLVILKSNKGKDFNLVSNTLFTFIKLLQGNDYLEWDLYNEYDFINTYNNDLQDYSTITVTYGDMIYTMQDLNY